VIGAVAIPIQETIFTTVAGRTFKHDCIRGQVLEKVLVD